MVIIFLSWVTSIFATIAGNLTVFGFGIFTEHCTHFCTGEDRFFRTRDGNGPR
jgi:hypothetical protein